MKSFLELMEEKDQGKHAVLAFGRMNPPTSGHEKVVNKVKEVAAKHDASHHVVLSHSQSAKKDPLSQKDKIKHAKRAFPGTNIEGSSKEHPTIFHHAEKLHKQGVTHLHVVAGSDRVGEYKKSLNHYNGKADKTGHVPYHFKKITVHSSGERDPDAEGATGISGTKMREHAKNGHFHEFKKGVSSHMSDTHAKEMMHDVRKGMGLHEDVNRGLFRAIFVTGGPGSGKDIIIREAIAESKIVELNFIQAQDYLSDKQQLTEKTNDFRRESIRNRGPLIINGPADDRDRIDYIKEELESLGYETMMVFVDTSDEVSKHRNSLLSRMMSESVRQDKWAKSQRNTKYFNESFETFIGFDNTGDITSKEQDLHGVYESTTLFLDSKAMGYIAEDWMTRNNKIDFDYKINRLFKENKNDKKTNRFLQTTKNYSSPRAKGPDDIGPDNAGSIVSIGSSDEIKGNTGPRKEPRKTYTFGQNAGVYAEEKGPTVKVEAKRKESNFTQDKDKIKRIKSGDTSGKASSVGRPDGLGSTWDSRTNGEGLTGGAGLANQTYSEDMGYSNANPSSTSFPSGGSVNPLSSEYDKKDFKNFRDKYKKVQAQKESVDSPCDDMGVSGTLSGASNKEPMETPADKFNLAGITIKKKKNK